MKLNYQIGIDNDPEVEAIHEYSLKILSEVGAAFHSPKILEIFKKHGAKVDGEVVYFNRELIENALKTVPETFDWYGRDGKSIVIGDHDTKYIPVYGPIYVLEDGKYEHSNHRHLVNMHKLYETSKVTDASNTNVIDVSYVDAAVREQYRLGVTLKYCQKPMMGLVSSETVSEMSIENIKNFYGFGGKGDDRIISMGLIDAMGPMRLSRDMCESLKVYAENDQCVMICTGATDSLQCAPQSYAADFTMGNAMLLAVVTLTQLIRPGTPCVISGEWKGADIRISTSGAYGAVEGLWGAAACKRMSEYYHIPMHANSAITESKYLDYQCGAESFLHILSSALLKVDCILHGCGVLDSMNSVSYEKMMLDEELFTAVRHMQKGFEVNDETMMMDTIKKIGPAGMIFERTRPSYRRDFFMPKLAIRDSHNYWIQNGCPSAEDKAAEAYKKRLAEYQLPELTADQQKILDDLIPEEYRGDC